MSIRTELSSLTWLTPWAALSPERAAALERTLARVLAPEHELMSGGARTPQAIAARQDTKDALFLLQAPEQLCLIYLDAKASGQLTYTLFESVEEFVSSCMLPDHLEDSDEDV